MQQVWLPFSEQQIAAFFLVLARITPLFFFAPMFSSRTVPTRVKGVVAVALAVGISPIARGTAEIPLEVTTIVGLLMKELLVGFGFAFAIGALYAALQVAGALLDLTIGFAFGSTIDPFSGNNNAVMAQAYAMIGALIFIAIGGEEFVVAGLAQTYDVIGLTQTAPIGPLVETAIDAFAGIFLGAIQVAGPILLALVLTDAAFGVISRVVPQLNVFQVALPAKVVIGLVLLIATLPFLAGWMTGQLQEVWS